MSRKPAPDRSMYEQENFNSAPWGPAEVNCPRCQQEGLYLGMEDQLAEGDDQAELVVIGWYPIYCCDDCKVIWFGSVR